MSRQTYPRSDETFKVLAGHEAEFAREADKDASYFNKLKNDVEPDPYSRFRALFRTGCRTSAPVEVWLHDLQAIFVRSRKLQLVSSELTSTLLQKIQSDSDTLKECLAAIQDGNVDKSECHAILAKLATNEEISNSIKQTVLDRLGELTEGEDRRLRVA